MFEIKKTLTSVSPKVPIVIVFAALGLGLLCNYLFFEKHIGISFPILCVTATVVLFGMLQMVGRKPTWAEYWLAIPLLLFAVMVAVRASPVLTVFNVLASYGLAALLVRAASGQSFHPRIIFGYLVPVLSTILYFGESTTPFSEALTEARGGEAKKRLGHVLKAIVVAIPFLVIFLVLFSNADLVFQSSISGIFDALDRGFWPQVLIVAVITLFFAGALTTVLLQKYAKTDDAESALPEQDMTFVVTFLNIINALFVFFIVIQVKYLFSGPEGLQGFGFTYAGYARNGFFELMAVAVISFLLLYGAEAMVARQDGKHAPVFKWSAGLHVAMVIVIVASAFRRLGLYEQAYGFTEQRLYAHAAVLWLAVVFGLMLVKIIRNTDARKFSFQVLVSAFVGFALLNIMNPDAFVARKNLQRFEATGKIDVPYLGELSADAVPVVIAGLRGKDPALLSDYVKKYREYHQGGWSPDGPWQSFNFSEAEASAALTK